MADINNPVRPEEEEYTDDIPFNTAEVFSEYFADKTDANIMRTPKYLKGYDKHLMGMNSEQQTRVQLRKEVIDDNFIQTQTVVDYDTEHFKYTDFNDPMFMYQDPLFPTFDIIIDTNYSPLLTDKSNISSLRRFLNEYSVIPGIEARQQIYSEFQKTLYTLFNSDFKKIDRNKSYYINSINGLDKMTAKIVDFEKDKITIVLNDDVSMITTYLSQLYNNLAYSYKDQRNMIPANLLRFNMYIKIHDIRNMIDRIPKYKPNDTATLGESYNTSFDKSYQIYYLQDCTFDFFKSKTFDDSITVGGFDASLNNKVGAITLEVTYKSITIESGFPLIKNNISDLKSSAITLQNKNTSLVADSSSNMVFINNEKSVDAFNDELETLQKPDINSNKPYVQPSYDDTNINTINLMNRLRKTEREFNMNRYKIYGKSKMNGSQGNEVSGDVISFLGVDPQWKSPIISDTTPEIIQEYRDVRLDPFNGGRPYEGDVQVNGPGAIPQWLITDTSSPEVYAMKQSVLNELNFIGFIHTLPWSIINFFMGGFHGMVEEVYIGGSGTDVIYAPRGAQDYIGGNVIYPPVLDGDVVPNMDSTSGLNRLDDEFIPEYPEGQLPDPNVLNGEVMPINPSAPPDELEGDIIPGSIIQPGGVFSDPTLLDGENLNFQIPSDVLLETIYIPMMWHVNAPLEGSISMDWHPQDPLEGTISMEYTEQEPLEGTISMEFHEQEQLQGTISMEYNKQEPLEGTIEMSFYVKDPLDGYIEMLIPERDPLEGALEFEIKSKVDLEGRISQEIKERDPFNVRISNAYKQRDFIELIKPIYTIPIKASISHYVDTSTREKPEFKEVILYTYPEFERKIELGTLYLNVTEENLMPIVYLYSKVDEFKSLINYYVYNRVTSEVKQPNVTIDQTRRDIVPLNLIYSYNNTVDIAKTMKIVYTYNNEVNKVNNLVATYVFGEYPIKEEMTEIKLYNNSVIPVLMPYVYLYEPSNKETNFETEERVYQMEINQFGNNIPNGLRIDADVEVDEYPVQLGYVVNNVAVRKEFTLPILYEPSKIKKLLEPQLLYEPAEKALFEPSRVYDDSELIIKNIFEPDNKIKETQLEEFGKRLDNVKIGFDTVVLKDFPYTTMSYVPLYEIEKDTTRDKTLEKEKLEFIKHYKKPLTDDHIAIKPILDKDSELAIKLEGDRIDTEQRERTNKEEYEFNIASLSDLDRIIEKKVPDAYEPPRKNPDGVEVDQTLTLKTIFKESYIGKPEEKPVVEGEERLKGERVDLDPRELAIERLGNIHENDIEVKDREYLSEEAIDYDVLPRRSLVVENIDSEIKKKKELDGESLDTESLLPTEMPVEEIDSMIKDRKYLDIEAIDYSIKPQGTLDGEYIDENTNKSHANLDGEILDYELKNKPNLTEEKLDYELKNKPDLTEERLDYELKNKPDLTEERLDYELKLKPNLDGENLDYELKNKINLTEERLDYELKLKPNLDGENLDYELKVQPNLEGENLDYEIKPKSLLSADSLDYEITEKETLKGENLDYVLNERKTISLEKLDHDIHERINLDGENLDYELKNKPDLTEERLDYDLKLKPNLNGENLDYDLRSKPNLDGENLDYDLRSKPNLDGENLDYELKSKPNLEGENLDYELKLKPNLDGENLDYELKLKPNLEGENLDYDLRTKPNLDGENLDYELKLKPNLEGENLDYELKLKPNLEGENLDYDLKLKPNLDGENLDYELKLKPNLEGENLDYELKLKPNLDGENLDYDLKLKPNLDGENLDFELKNKPNLDGEALDYEIRDNMNLTEERLDYELKMKPNLSGENLDYELKLKPNLEGEVLDYELKNKANLDGEALDYEIRNKPLLPTDSLDYEIPVKGNLEGKTLDYDIKEKALFTETRLDYVIKENGGLTGESLDYDLKAKPALTQESLDYEIKPKGSLTGESLDFQIVSNSKLNGETLGVEIPIRGNLYGESLDFEVTQEEYLTPEYLDYDIRVKSSLNNESLDSDGEVRTFLGEERLDYDIRNNDNLNGEKLDYEIKPDELLNGENVIDENIKTKQGLNNERLG